MTNPILPVSSVCASAPTLWLGRAGWSDAKPDQPESQEHDDEPVTEAVLLQRLRERSPVECNALVTGLSQVQLHALGGIASAGLAFGEQAEFFDLLAGCLDGGNLVRVSAAYLHSTALCQWADSVRLQASTGSKLGYLRAWAERTDAAPARKPGAVKSVDAVISATSLIAANAFAGLAGCTTAVDEALHLLVPQPSDTARLQSVVEAALQMHAAVPRGLGQALIASDSQPLVGMVCASAYGTHPHAKAAVFEVSVQAFKRLAANACPTQTWAVQAANAALAQALSRLVFSDTTGILAALEAHYGGGQGLVSYLIDMVRQRRTTELRVMTEQLLHGHDACEKPCTYLAQHDAWGRYRHAAALGYYVGAVQAACRVAYGDGGLGVDTQVAIFGGGLVAGPANLGQLWLSGGAARAFQSISDAPPCLGDEALQPCLRHSLQAACADGEAATQVLRCLLQGRPCAASGAERAYAAAAHRVFVAHG